MPLIRELCSAKKRLHPISVLILLPALTGFSTYDTLAEWESEVGAHYLETFDGIADQGIPAEGGSIELNGFTIVSDGNHNTRDGGGLCGTSFCPPEIVDGVFRGDIHAPEVDRPTFLRLDFDMPISAFSMLFFDVEDEGIGVKFEQGSVTHSVSRFVDIGETVFLGVVLVTPVSSIEFNAEYQTFSVDDVRWSVVPEPSALTLLYVAILGLAATRRN